MPDANIQRSKSGLDYVPGVLYEGPRVVTRVVLTQIPHTTSPPELVLKIGKYERRKATFGFNREVVESTDPKSEVSLSPEETSTLLEFLKENANLVLSGAGTYLKVETGNIQELLSEIQTRLVEADQSKLEELVRAGTFLPKNVLDMAVLRFRQDELDKLERSLASDEVEQVFQKWFERNNWALGTDCVYVLDERRIDVENIADYLTVAFDGHVDIVEVKRPGLTFWSSTLDHGNHVPHSDLVKAIAQVQVYQFELEREMNSTKLQERLGGKFPIAKPRALLIFGRSNSWESSHFRAQRLLNGSYSSIQVLTYDQVFERAKKLLPKVTTDA